MVLHAIMNIFSLLHISSLIAVNYKFLDGVPIGLFDAISHQLVLCGLAIRYWNCWATYGRLSLWSKIHSYWYISERLRINRMPLRFIALMF